MNDVGTVSWARRTGGRLTPMQAVGYTVGQLGQQGRRLRTRRISPPPASAMAPEPAVPDSALAEEVSRYAAEHLSAPLLNHSWRVWRWANVLLPGDHRVDVDLLLAACLLHDAGLDASRAVDGPRGCFTIRSADIATQILERAGFDSTATDSVTAAIIGHMNVTPLAGADPLAAALHAATNLDVTGGQLHLIPRSTRNAALDRYPRDGFTTCFSRSFRREFRRAPLTRAGLAWAIGLPVAIRLNPMTTGV